MTKQQKKLTRAEYMASADRLEKQELRLQIELRQKEIDRLTTQRDALHYALRRADARVNAYALFIKMLLNEAQATTGEQPK